VENPNALLAQIEQARLWAYFHKDWLLSIRSALRPQLPSEYHLFVESEAILISPIDGETPNALLPDLALSRPDIPNHAALTSRSTKGTAAVVEVDEPLEIDTRYSLLIRRAPENRVVAALEILSPSNKGLGNRFDEEKHLRKRASLLEAGVQLMEIDALVRGHRDLPDPLMTRLSEFARVIWTAAHFDGRRKYRGWGWNDADPLPTIPWFVDERIEVCVDLSDSLRQAADFNRWNELVASAERGRE
jgi:hypothetical protein